MFLSSVKSQPAHLKGAVMAGGASDFRGVLHATGPALLVAKEVLNSAPADLSAEGPPGFAGRSYKTKGTAIECPNQPGPVTVRIERIK
jgi:hypothetical protein